MIRLQDRWAANLGRNNSTSVGTLREKILSTSMTSKIFQGISSVFGGNNSNDKMSKSTNLTGYTPDTNNQNDIKNGSNTGAAASSSHKRKHKNNYSHANSNKPPTVKSTYLAGPVHYPNHVTDYLFFRIGIKQQGVFRIVFLGALLHWFSLRYPVETFEHFKYNVVLRWWRRFSKGSRNSSNVLMNDTSNNKNDKNLLLHQDTDTSLTGGEFQSVSNVTDSNTNLSDDCSTSISSLDPERFGPYYDLEGNAVINQLLADYTGEDDDF